MNLVQKFIKPSVLLFSLCLGMDMDMGAFQGQAAELSTEEFEGQSLEYEFPEYQFIGRHFIVSYSECDHEALIDVNTLSEKMKEASAASGAHVLSSTEYIFPGNGLSMVCLLSESHASIHTYPEFDSCFVDLFTCGTRCSAEKFDEVLREYLKPQKVNSQIMLRE